MGEWMYRSTFSVKCFMLPPSSLRNITVQKTSILEEELGVGHILRNEKTFTLLSEQGSVPYY
jgi:hypothetical protein